MGEGSCGHSASCECVRIQGETRRGHGQPELTRASVGIARQCAQSRYVHPAKATTVLKANVLSGPLRRHGRAVLVHLDIGRRLEAEPQFDGIRPWAQHRVRVGGAVGQDDCAFPPGKYEVLWPGLPRAFRIQSSRRAARAAIDRLREDPRPLFEAALPAREKGADCNPQDFRVHPDHTRRGVQG